MSVKNPYVMVMCLLTLSRNRLRHHFRVAVVPTPLRAVVDATVDRRVTMMDDMVQLLVVTALAVTTTVVVLHLVAMITMVVTGTGLRPALMDHPGMMVTGRPVEATVTSPTVPRLQDVTMSLIAMDTTVVPGEAHQGVMPVAMMSHAATGRRRF